MICFRFGSHSQCKYLVLHRCLFVAVSQLRGGGGRATDSTVHDHHPRGTASAEVNPDRCVSPGRHLSLIPYLDVTGIGAAKQHGVCPLKSSSAHNKSHVPSLSGVFHQWDTLTWKRSPESLFVFFTQWEVKKTTYVTQSTPFSRGVLSYLLSYWEPLNVIFRCSAVNLTFYDL